MHAAEMTLAGVPVRSRRDLLGRQPFGAVRQGPPRSSSAPERRAPQMPRARCPARTPGTAFGLGRSGRCPRRARSRRRWRSSRRCRGPLACRPRRTSRGQGSRQALTGLRIRRQPCSRCGRFRVSQRVRTATLRWMWLFRRPPEALRTTTFTARLPRAAPASQEIDRVCGEVLRAAGLPGPHAAQGRLQPHGDPGDSDWSRYRTSSSSP